MSLEHRKHSENKRGHRHYNKRKDLREVVMHAGRGKTTRALACSDVVAGRVRGGEVICGKVDDRN